MALRETLEESQMVHVRATGNGEHWLYNPMTKEIEVWLANRHHASYGITYKNTCLEFAHMLKTIRTVHDGDCGVCGFPETVHLRTEDMEPLVEVCSRQNCDGYRLCNTR